MIKNIKVHVKTQDESEAVQKKLFSLGCKWQDSRSTIKVHGRYLFVDNEGIITYAPLGFFEHFLKSPHEEWSVKDILDYKPNCENTDKKRVNMITFNFEDESDKELTLSDVKSDEFFVNFEGWLCHKINNYKYNVISDSDGTPVAGTLYVDFPEKRPIQRIIGKPKKIEF